MKIPGITALSTNDPSSFSNPEGSLIRHAHIEWRVNFERQVLSGSVKLTIEKVQDSAEKLVLDVKDLTIFKVSCNNAPLKFVLGKVVHTFGQPLEISLPANTKIFDILIEYETSPEAVALQWLQPEQTSGKKYPYLFSQCKSIHCRTILPCQDTPAVKFTYTAEVVTDTNLTVLMSAISAGKPVSEAGGMHRFKFEQAVSIPSYLLAIVVAAITSLPISERCSVWAEEGEVKASAWEFAQAEEMLKIAEDICGAYEWGRYDLLVLPPCFAYGGIENPCITFVTPTCVAGDRSLAEVIAHEITHSWTGNLVGIKNFEHFWLNEGCTMFIQRKIESRLFGVLHRHFSAILGIKELTDCVKAAKFPEYETTLVTDLIGIDPEDVYSFVPYEKGHTLLFYLETLLGGPEAFDPFIKYYVKEFRGKTIATEQFKMCLYTFFDEKKNVLDSVDWQTWFFGTGMPPVIPQYDTSLADQCSKLAERWQSCPETDLSSMEKAPLLTDLSSPQKREFLHQLLLSEITLSHAKLAKMRELYNMDAIGNSEVKYRWLRLCIKSKCEDRISDALDFAISQGRMKFVRPLFRDLYQWETSRERALATFKANRGRMMYITARLVAIDLGLAE